MTEKEIETKLLKYRNELIDMRYAFGNIVEMADCDEPPKQRSNYTIEFIKDGLSHICSVESKDWCEIYPKDLMPVIKCLKKCCQDKLNHEYEKYQQIVKGVKCLDKLLSAIED